MDVVKVAVTPQEVPAQAKSNATRNLSEIKSQFWFEIAFGLIADTFEGLANILIALMTPAAVVALVMGIWRVAADLGWAGAFLITGGFFSHWQVWIVLAVGLKMLSSTLLAWGSRTNKFSQEN